MFSFGGFGYSVAEIVFGNDLSRIGVFDENEPKNLTLKNGKISYLGKYNSEIYANVSLLITTKNNKISAKITQLVQYKGTALIHQSAQISKN